MSISEARRQIDHAFSATDIVGSALTADENSILMQRLTEVIAHSASAIVEALADSKPYDGDLNSLRVPVTILRQISVEATKHDMEDIGMEDLLVAIRARIKHLGLDT